MEADDTPCCQPLFWAYLIISLVLLAFAGITSGLALGLLSFSQVDLEVLIKAGQPQAQKNAAKVMAVVKNEHLLLCTLLTGKSLAMAALPIFMDSIIPAWVAILVSTAFVLAFVEIIPQAVCSRYALSLGAKLATFVSLLLLVFFPVSCPISRLLDWFFGKGHGSLSRRAELKTLVDLHANEAGRGGDLSLHETSIITGALDLAEKIAKDAMTPISEIFSLDINSKLDMHTMGLIMSKGHSRIPIYSGYPTNIVGVILVKNLIFCRPEEEIPIKYTAIRKISRVYDNWPLYDVLHLFEKGHCQMAVVIQSKEDANNIANNAIELSSIDEKEYLSNSTDASSLFSIETDYYSAVMTNVIEKDENLHPQYKKREQGGGKTLQDYLESHRGNLDEGVIGIIIMQDVMEELLQVMLRSYSSFD
ncbi:DUF21 domain-containing protein At5g52790-like [Corylus avellana]|uniref:DUF21 domain-containing protein At5g52790-like n=1 Tax=Corylus avellana TaxID=13451 RepID=UPI00286A89F8|nr:DUF21 domain-containing protein At5g52790-like [Corylus avellana]